MIKKLFIPLFLFSFLSANDIMIGQKQNVLYIQNLIETEDKIAKNFEKYLLTQFKIPTFEELRVDEYLGTNFSLSNRMGENLAFISANDLKLKYAISKKGYKEANKYITLLYNRDLYRDNTYVYFEEIEDEDDSTKTIIDTSNSYVKIELQSDEAKTIYKILDEYNEKIEKECTDTLKSTYCNQNEKAIRYYNESSDWIEYDKKLFKEGNVSTNLELGSDVCDNIENEKLKELATGVYILQVDKKAKYIYYSKKEDDAVEYKCLEVK